MGNSILNTGLNIYEFLSYFSVEIICVLGIILNFIFSMFSLKSRKIKKISDITTCGIFCINSLILTVFLFQGENFCIKSDMAVFNNAVIFLKLFINLFAIFFIIATYKFIRKSQYKVPIINSILILIILLSGLLLGSDNFTFIYVLLELIIILIYRYASEMRIRKNGIYSPEFITLGFCATFLFVMFYFMDFVVNDPLQKSIMQSCMVLSLLLKIGLFPVYNYSIDKKCRSNIPYSILLFCLLPFVGSVAFSRMMLLCMFNEVCQLSMSLFVLIFALLSALAAFKTKNLTSCLIYVAQFYTCFYILNSSYVKDLNPNFIITVLSIILALYSMLRTYKNSRRNTIIFSILLIVCAFSIPLFGSNILMGIYTFDKTGFFALNVIVFCNMLIIIKALKIIEGFYKKIK